jgi:7-carboxy-7-deazaguanine synthase
MLIKEIFYTLQGEGRLGGIPSVFVRVAGCPLRCRWCDTKYALEESSGHQYSVAEAVNTIQNWPCRHVVITGGEPMVSPELPELLKKLKVFNKHITIETAGIAYVPELACDLMSISPKLSNSTPDDPELSAAHEKSRLDVAVLRQLIDNYEYQLKFVVDSEDDLDEIQQTIQKIGDVKPEKVMLMPQAAMRDELAEKSEMVVDMCMKTGYSFCQRLHILLWNYQKDVQSG